MVNRRTNTQKNIDTHIKSFLANSMDPATGLYGIPRECRWGVQVLESMVRDEAVLIISAPVSKTHTGAKRVFVNATTLVMGTVTPSNGDLLDRMITATVVNMAKRVAAGAKGLVQSGIVGDLKKPREGHTAFTSYLGLLDKTVSQSNLRHVSYAEIKDTPEEFFQTTIFYVDSMLFSGVLAHE
jgi:hypothetical protein